MSKKNYSRQQREYVVSPEAFNNEISEYYSGKRVGPGELKELERFKDAQIKATINDCNTLSGQSFEN